MPEIADHCLLDKDAVVAWHRGLVREKVLFEDDIQTQAVGKLQQFADNITVKDGMLSRILSRRRTEKQGLYIHGGVGRGKSFLMDGFYLQLRCEKKMRAHFHQFMRRFHEDMKKREGQKDPLIAVADEISERAEVICFDEFHVSDITDAMILGRLVGRILDNGARMVMTSNYAPKDLYPNGLARDRFLPAIAMLEERLDVFALDGGEDYRLRHISQGGRVFFSSQDENQLKDIFDALACGISLPPQIKINGRQLPAIARSSDAIWFSFEQLCGGAVGKADYLELAGRFATVVVSDTPKLGDDSLADVARRFTWLVDILYDNKVTLMMSAAAPLEELYDGGIGGESGRTISRLIEMQSPDYWGKSLSLNSTP